MHSDNSRLSTFRRRLIEGKPLVGLFARLVAPEAAELLADTTLDFVILDAEHGTFSRTQISGYVQAARGEDLPVLVRVPEGSEAWLQHVAAVGAAGVVVPHVESPADLARAVGFFRGRAVERAYAGMGRASGYRRGTWPSFREHAAGQLVFLAQIDEPPGVRHATELAGIDGVDGLFLGSLGLALASKADNADDPIVRNALREVCAAGVAAGKSVGLHLMQQEKLAEWLAQGVSVYVVGSDYGTLRDNVSAQASGFVDRLNR